MTATPLLRRPATPADLFSRLDALGIHTRTVDHPALFTVAESSKIDLQLGGGHTKNLFLKDARGQLFLVVALAETVIDLKALPKAIGSARLSFGSAELLEAKLGVKPGSVTAFAVINDEAGEVGVIIDGNLMGFDRINAHPLVNTATTSIAREDLLRFIRATGHEPRIVALGAPAPA